MIRYDKLVIGFMKDKLTNKTISTDEILISSFSSSLRSCVNVQGMVSVFDLRVTPSKPLCVISPKDKYRYNAQFVRQCAFSEDGSILLAVDDTSSVVQYERVD